MGKRDFHPLSANFLLAKHLKSHWSNYAKGKAEAGQKAEVADWRVARTIFVADDDKTAARYGREDANSPYRFYFEQMRAKMKRGKRLYVFKSDKEQPDEEITHDWVMDHCVLHGSVNKVVDGILALREETGDFGELVYAGMDWVDPALAKRSMQLMAEEVMPRVNAAIGQAGEDRGRINSAVHDAPGDADQRAEQQDAGGDGLDRKAVVAFVGRFAVAANVKHAPGDPDQPEHGGGPIGDIKRKQPERRQEDRHPFQRVHLHAEYPLEIGDCRWSPAP